MDSIIILAFTYLASAITYYGITYMRGYRHDVSVHGAVAAGCIATLFAIVIFMLRSA